MEYVSGAELVAEARRTVSSYLREGIAPEQNRQFRNKYSSSAGVFVTINQDASLRGCIGYPEPEGPLHRMLARAAIAAATQDPRFAPLQSGDLDKVTFEVTVLEPPRLLCVKSPHEYESHIIPGRDGLMVRDESRSGLLLPQVASQYGWTALELLEHTCLKAGMPKDHWKHPKTRVWSFRGACYSE